MGSFAQDWSRCLRSPADENAWDNFLTQQKRPITSIVFRVARRFGVQNLDEIDDALQEVCLKLSSQAHREASIGGDDAALESYMKAVIANAAHDYFRSQRAKRRDLLAVIPLTSDLPAHAAESKEIDGRVLQRQLQDLVGADERSRSIFQLYYRFGWTANEIARIPDFGLSSKGVESLVGRVASDLRKKTRAAAVSSTKSEGSST